MPRPPETPGAPLTERFNVPSSRRMLAYLDAVRGTRTRAGYVRDLVRADQKAKLKDGTFHPSMVKGYSPHDDPGQREHYHDNPQGPEDTNG